ncbi:hypothetical protein F2Q69_00041044 [Brassica cretica]|uniref:Uncharacterized protein n=1 Tax=Brassica cretica TaxID=69181 RepID=A0A8S9NGF9_BRACR|nr:hypothetical protein F2Q69_00041044 [Brassica cretica]
MLRRVTARETPRPTKSNQLTADALSSTHNDLRTTLNARKSRRISAGDPDPKERSNGDLQDKLNVGACDLQIRLNRSKPTDLRKRLEQTKISSNDTPSSKNDSSDAPKSKGEADSSADEEQPANRRRIEVILSQQTLSSDDENDDTPVLEDLRDVLKRKFEFENSNSSTLNDLRTTLNARKSRRISAVDPDPKECLNDDLRDKLNAGACDLRIHLNRSKPTDLRRRLEQTKMSNLAGSPPEPPSREQVFLLSSDRFPGDAPKSNGKADSSADKEQPANRRCIEAVLSQQTLSSDDENDDTPVLEDLRDVLKRKFESENSNSSTHNDLRTTLNARKSQRISAVDPDPKERSDGDLRDKLNA